MNDNDEFDEQCDENEKNDLIQDIGIEAEINREEEIDWTLVRTLINSFPIKEVV